MGLTKVSIPMLEGLQESVNEATNAGDSVVAGGNIWPLNSQESLSLGSQSSVVLTSADRFKVNTGSKVDLLYLWEPSGSLPSPPFTITSIVKNTTGGYDFTIDSSTYIFTTQMNRGLRQEAHVEGYGAVPDGSTVADDSFALCHSENGYCKLGTRKEYKLNSLPDETNLTLRGDKSVIKFSQVLADRQYNSLDYEGVIFDGEGSDATKCQQIRGNSNIKFRKVTGRNLGPSDWIFFFEISTQNVHIDIEDCYNENLEATENGVVGDLNGSCRFIVVRDESGGTPVTTPSKGRIVGVYGKNLLPREDGDMIQVISSSSLEFELFIDNIFGENIAKRVVKIQANGCPVGHVSADARSNSENMFSIVSHYGQNGSVGSVSGAGQFQNGCDTQYGSTSVGRVSVVNTGVVSSQGAAIKYNGGGTCAEVYGQGFQHVAAAYVSLEADARCVFEDVQGSSDSTPVYCRTEVNIEEFALKRSRATSSASQAVLCTDFSGSNTTVGRAIIEDVDSDSTASSCVDVRNAERVEYKDLTGNQNIVLAVNSGKVYGSNAVSKGGTRAVLLTSVTEAIVEGSQGASSEQVRTQGCDNAVILNTVTKGAIPAVNDEFSNPSTNSQEIQTITLV